jgi:hypothetical protein
MDMLQVDPMLLVSQKAAEEQESALKAFNKEWAQIYKERRGNLTIADKINFQRAKQGLISRQNMWAASQQIFQQDAKIMANPANWDKYDMSKFKEAYKNFLKTGYYPTGGALEPSEMSDYEMRMLFPVPSTGYRDFERPIPGGKESVMTYVDETQAREHLRKLPFQDPSGRILKRYINHFNQLPADEQKKYLDAADLNNNGLSQEERQNAITEAYADKNWSQYIKENVNQTLPLWKQTTGGSGGFSINIGGTSSKYTPTSAQSVTLGKTNYNKYHPFLRMPLWTIPADNIRVLEWQEGEADDNRKPKTTLKVQLTGYDEGADEFTFNVVEPYWGYGTEANRGKGDKIAIKRSELPPELDDINIIINGKPVRIGDVERKSTGTPIKVGKYDNIGQGE